jgi:AraC family transcriptional regulator
MQLGAPARPLPARTEFMTGEAALRGLRCAEALYPPGLRLPRHLHEKPSITLVAAGSLVELQGPRLAPVPCGEGAVVIRPAGDPHGDEVGPRGVVNLELELEPALLGGPALPAIGRAIHPAGADPALSRRLRQALRARERVAALLIEALALEVLGLLLPGKPAPSGPAPWLTRVHDRIRDEFRSDLTMAALARAVNVHPVYLARAFRSRYGTSPSELVRALRLAWAAAELEAGDRAIGDIALEAGFHDQSHLTRAFHAARGLPPGAYRRGARRASGRPT